MSKIIGCLLLFAVGAFGEDARHIVEEAQKRSRSNSEHYEGTLQVIDAKHRVSTKQWIFDRLGSFGESKAILRFTAPPEVKGVALLIVNHPDKSSDQWMWTPAIGRERRIALQDRATRFFGTDFSFEDLEERDVNQYDYKLLGEETVAGAKSWKLESRPKQTKTSQYTQSLTWVRKDNYAVVQVERYVKNKLVRRIVYNLSATHSIEVTDLTRDSKTILKLDKLSYTAPMKAEDFTVEALRK